MRILEDVFYTGIILSTWLLEDVETVLKIIGSIATIAHFVHRFRQDGYFLMPWEKKDKPKNPN